jgi:hypothetical protein
VRAMAEDRSTRVGNKENGRPLCHMIFRKMNISHIMLRSHCFVKMHGNMCMYAQIFLHSGDQVDCY